MSTNVFILCFQIMPQATEFIHEVNDSDDQGVFFFLRKGTRGTDRPTRSEKPKIKKKKKRLGGLNRGGSYIMR